MHQRFPQLLPVLLFFELVPLPFFAQNWQRRHVVLQFRFVIPGCRRRLMKGLIPSSKTSVGYVSSSRSTWCTEWDPVLKTKQAIKQIGNWNWPGFSNLDHPFNFNYTISSSAIFAFYSWWLLDISREAIFIIVKILSTETWQARVDLTCSILFSPAVWPWASYLTSIYLCYHLQVVILLASFSCTAWTA